MFKLSLLCFDKSSDLFPSLSEFEIKFIFRHTQKQFFAVKSYFINESCLTVGSNTWQMMCLKIPRANRIEIDSIKSKYFSLSQKNFVEEEETKTIIYTERFSRLLWTERPR